MAGVWVISDSNSEEYAKQLERMAIDAGKKSDIRNLSWAVRNFVRDHQGEFPSTSDQAASHFDKDRRPPQTSGFELVFQGSLTELTNVPSQAVALIREREAWPTPRGKWARIFGMAGGEVHIVESDDNFQSWEAEHLIPPAESRPELKTRNASGLGPTRATQMSPGAPHTPEIGRLRSGGPTVPFPSP